MAIGCTFALAGGLATPSGSLIAKDAVWLVAVATVQLLVALGFSAVVGSRATAVGVLLGWQLAVSPLLLSIDQLGVLRQLVPRAGELRLQPFGTEPLGFAMTAGAAVTVLGRLDSGPAGSRRASHGATGGVAFVLMTGDLPSPPRVVLPERLVDIGLAVGLALVVVAAEAFGNRELPESLGEIVLGVTGALALLEPAALADGCAGGERGCCRR